jgi:hypothetical protein
MSLVGSRCSLFRPVFPLFKVVFILTLPLIRLVPHEFSLHKLLKLMLIQIHFYLQEASLVGENEAELGVQIHH